jgi:hypothetical protein
VDDAKTVAAHPEQEALLAFGPDINARVEEGAQKPPVAQKDAEKLVVIYVYIVEARCVEKIVAVNENRHPAPVTQLPRNVVRRIKMHAINTPSKVFDFKYQLTAHLECRREACPVKSKEKQKKAKGKR